jgi:hypothetical protein
MTLTSGCPGERSWSVRRSLASSALLASQGEVAVRQAESRFLGPIDHHVVFGHRVTYGISLGRYDSLDPVGHLLSVPGSSRFTPTGVAAGGFEDPAGNSGISSSSSGC